MTRISAAQYINEQNRQARKKPVDHEGQIHRGIVSLLEAVLPADATYHHSPNEVDMQGADVARAISKARRLGTRKGWPDIEVIWRGRFFGIEVKSPNGRLSDSQLLTHAILAQCGCEVAVVRSVDEAKDALRKWGLV